MLKLNLVDILFRRKPPVPLPYYWDGYVRTHFGNSASTHNLPDQETQASFFCKCLPKFMGPLAMLLTQVSQFSFHCAYFKSLISISKQQGAGRDGLLTILTRVMSEAPSARFVQEFGLVLFLYHCLCTMPTDQFDQEDLTSFVLKTLTKFMQPLTTLLIQVSNFFLSRCIFEFFNISRKTRQRHSLLGKRNTGIGSTNWKENV